MPVFIPILGFAIIFAGFLPSIINRDEFFVRSRLYCFKVICIARDSFQGPFAKLETTLVFLFFIICLIPCCGRIARIRTAPDLSSSFFATTLKQ